MFHSLDSSLVLLSHDQRNAQGVATTFLNEWAKLPVHYARKFFGADLEFSSDDISSSSEEEVEDSDLSSDLSSDDADEMVESMESDRWKVGMALEGRRNGHYSHGHVQKVHQNGNYSFKYVVDEIFILLSYLFYFVVFTLLFCFIVLLYCFTSY
jgi:hypothetical protein